jgi:predicted YcjX-like family ATPase
MKEKIYSMILKSFSSKYFFSLTGKTACITLLVVNSSDGNAQKVFSVKYESQADLKVYVVKYESQADLKVFKVKYESQAADNNGKWFFTKYENQADKKIFFVDYESQAELKIFFVPYESQAGWREKSKKALLY